MFALYPAAGCLPASNRYPDFLFPEPQAPSIPPIRRSEYRLNTSPTLRPLVLSPAFLSPGDPQCSSGAHLFRLRSPPASWHYLRNPLLQRGGGGTSGSQDSCSLETVAIVGAPERILWSLPPQLGLGLSGRPRPHLHRSGGYSRLPISDAGKCFPPIPPHPWTAALFQARG